MDLRIPEEQARYQWHGQTLPDLRYQWHGPTNPALVEARRQYARNSQELAIAKANSHKKKPPPPKCSAKNKFEQPPLVHGNSIKN
jgi:hypothetical protein